LGKLRIQITRNEVNFIVSSLEEITNVIIPLFDKLPLPINYVDGKWSFERYLLKADGAPLLEMENIVHF